MQTEAVDLNDDGVRRTRDRALIQLYRQRRLQHKLDREPERLRAHYEQQKLRFSSPLKLRVRRLRVALSPQAAGVMARLERVYRDVQSKSADMPDTDTSLETLAAELDGSVETLEEKTLAALVQEAPKLARFVAGLEPGAYTPPFRTEAHLEMGQLLDRTAPVPLPFAVVRERVRQDYLRHYGQTVYAELRAAMLAQANFQIASDRLATLQLGVPQRDPPLAGP